MTGYVALNDRPQGGHARPLSPTLANAQRDVPDVDCSYGYLAAPLAAAGARIVGIELDRGAAEAARAFCEAAPVGDVESIELPPERRPSMRSCAATSSSTSATRERLSSASTLFSGRTGSSSSPRRTSPTGPRGSRSSGAGGATPTGGSSIGRTRICSRRRTSSRRSRPPAFAWWGSTIRRPSPASGPSASSARRTRARARQSLFAYQFLLAVTPR